MSKKCQNMLSSKINFSTFCVGTYLGTYILTESKMIVWNISAKSRSKSRLFHGVNLGYMGYLIYEYNFCNELNFPMEQK